MKKVFVGVGHGGTDYGACANDLRESEIALDIAKECYDILARHGVEVVISRTTQGTDALDDLTPKINRCNAFDPDLAVDIHINAGGGEGFEAFYYHGGGTSYATAKNIEKEVKAMGQTSRGLKIKLNDSGNDYFGWIRLVNAPSVILEAAFIDNSEDVEKIRTIEGRKKFGVAYAKGILNTLGITYKESAGDEDMVIYKTYNDVPEYAKPTIKKLMDAGALKGDNSGNLNLTDEMIRIFVVNDRMGVYDK